MDMEKPIASQFHSPSPHSEYAVYALVACQFSQMLLFLARNATPDYDLGLD